MLKTNSTMAQQIAEAAIRFETRRNGHVPESATVVLSEDWDFANRPLRPLK